MIPLDLFPLDLLPLDLLPLDIPNNGTGESTPVSTYLLLGVILLALITMVGVLFLVRHRRRGKQ